MSFSSQVKKELIAHISAARHCRLAELAALVMMSGVLCDEVWYPDEENTFAGEKIRKLSHVLECDVNDVDSRLAMKLTVTTEGFLINPMLVERSCCKQAFVRGAFLATGSVTDPNKGYHFEIVCNTKKQADMLFQMIESFGLYPKQIERKKYIVVYLKDGSAIVDILNIMGAHVSLMDMENVRILKDMRNHVNRRVNCETANINKTVN
ncbi:MAG: DNA-binding protein WhiA, partial [Lachnospiraceae bacterium]|nr:DNA-binding protein WhiA [Lachnospiraceae bacterium]